MAFKLNPSTPLFQAKGDPQATYVRRTDEDIKSLPTRGTKIVPLTPSTNNNRRDRKWLANTIANDIKNNGGNIAVTGAVGAGWRGGGMVGTGATAYSGTEVVTAVDPKFAEMTNKKLARKIKRVLREDGSVQVDPASGTISPSSVPVNTTATSYPRAEAKKKANIYDSTQVVVNNEKVVLDNKTTAEAARAKVLADRRAVVEAAKAKAGVNKTTAEAARAKILADRRAVVEAAKAKISDRNGGKGPINQLAYSLSETDPTEKETNRTVTSEKGKLGTRPGTYTTTKIDYQTSGDRVITKSGEQMKDWARFVKDNPNWNKNQKDRSDSSKAFTPDKEEAIPSLTLREPAPSKPQEITAPLPDAKIGVKTKRIIGGQTKGGQYQTGLSTVVDKAKEGLSNMADRLTSDGSNEKVSCQCPKR